MLESKLEGVKICKANSLIVSMPILLSEISSCSTCKLFIDLIILIAPLDDKRLLAALMTLGCSFSKVLLMA